MTKTLRKNETVEDLKRPKNGEPYFVSDNVVTNLSIKVGVKSKHFVMTARFGGKKHPTRRTIGDAKKMSIDEARAIAVEWNGLNSQDIDPQHHGKDKAIEQERIDRQTFRCALEDYIAWLPERAKNRNASKEQRDLRNAFLDPGKNPFLDTPISKLSGADIQLLIEAVIARGASGQAYTMYGLLRTFFNWLLTPLRSKHYGIEHSPCARLKPSQMGLRKRSRERSHSSKEIRAYWAAADETPSPWGEYFKAVLLSGQRNSDVAQAIWSEIDFSRRLWTIPAERYKSDRDQPVPLSVPMVQILQHIRLGQSPDHGPFIFSTTDGRKPITGFSKATKAFRVLMAAKFNEMYPDDPPVDHWVIHDDRRTVRTGLSNLGVPSEVAEAVIGHERKGLERIYNTSKFKAQRRRALHLWAEEVKNIIDDPKHDHEDEDFEATDWPSRWNAAAPGNSVQ